VDAQEDDGITIYIIYRECEIRQPGRKEGEQIDTSATELTVEGSGKCMPDKINLREILPLEDLCSTSDEEWKPSNEGDH
jgi:hypothetical protein